MYDVWRLMRLQRKRYSNMHATQMVLVFPCRGPRYQSKCKQFKWHSSGYFANASHCCDISSIVW